MTSMTSSSRYDIDRLAETEYVGVHDPKFTIQTDFGRICLNPSFSDRNSLFDCRCTDSQVSLMLEQAESIFAQANLPFLKICGHDIETFARLKPRLEHDGWTENHQVIMIWSTEPQRQPNKDVRIEAIDLRGISQNDAYRSFHDENDEYEMTAWRYRCSNEPRLGGEQLIGWLGSEPVGIAGWFVVDGIARFRPIVTKEWAWGHGVATTLIRHVQDHPIVRAQETLVIFSRPTAKGGAQSLYERLGFRQCSDYYVYKRQLSK